MSHVSRSRHPQGTPRAPEFPPAARSDGTTPRPLRDEASSRFRRCGLAPSQFCLRDMLALLELWFSHGALPRWEQRHEEQLAAGASVTFDSGTLHLPA